MENHALSSSVLVEGPLLTETAKLSRLALQRDVFAFDWQYSNKVRKSFPEALDEYDFS